MMEYQDLHDFFPGSHHIISQTLSKKICNLVKEWRKSLQNFYYLCHLFANHVSQVKSTKSRNSKNFVRCTERKKYVQCILLRLIKISHIYYKHITLAHISKPHKSLFSEQSIQVAISIASNMRNALLTILVMGKVWVNVKKYLWLRLHHQKKNLHTSCCVHTCTCVPLWKWSSFVVV